jgi:hypothetical protein
VTSNREERTTIRRARPPTHSSGVRSAHIDSSQPFAVDRSPLGSRAPGRSLGRANARASPPSIARSRACASSSIQNSGPAIESAPSHQEQQPAITARRGYRAGRASSPSPPPRISMRPSRTPFIGSTPGGRTRSYGRTSPMRMSCCGRSWMIAEIAYPSRSGPPTISPCPGFTSSSSTRAPAIWTGRPTARISICNGSAPYRAARRRRRCR